MSTASKLKQDAKAAERAIRRKQAELKSKARQDARTAERRLRSVDRDTVASAAERVSGVVDTGGASTQETSADAEDIGDRAYRAGQAPAVVGASLDPSPSGAGMQLFASNAGVMDEGFIDGRGRRPRDARGREQQPQPQQAERERDALGLTFAGDGKTSSSSLFGIQATSETADELSQDDDPLGVGTGWL